MEYIDRNSWETKFPSTKVSCHLAWKTEVGTVPIGEFRITEVMQNGFQNMAFLSDPVGSWKVHTIYNPNSWAIFRNLMFHWYMHTFSEDVTSKAFLQKDNQKSLCWDQPPTSRDVEDSIFCSKLPYLFEIWWKNHHHRKSPKRIQPKKHTNRKWDSHDQPTNSSLPRFAEIMQNLHLEDVEKALKWLGIGPGGGFI